MNMKRKNEELSFEQKIEFYSVSLGIAGIKIDNPAIINLLVSIYDRILETKGAIGVDELLELRKKHLPEPPKESEPGKIKPPLTK